MEKQSFLFKFRKASNIDTLERMYEHMRDKVDDNDVAFFLGAYDHRKAELAVGRIFDKVPASAWKYVKRELGITGKEPNRSPPLALRVIIPVVSSACTPLILPGDGDGRPVRPASLLAVLGFYGVYPKTPQIPF